MTDQMSLALATDAEANAPEGSRISHIVRKVYAEAPGAFFSGRRYRYILTRRWSDAPPLMAIGLNPSIAGVDDDPTVRKLCGYARRIEWSPRFGETSTGFGGLVLVNAVPWIDTKPSAMLAAMRRGDDVYGDRNPSWVAQAAAQLRPGMILCGWGANGARLDQERLWECLRPLLIHSDLWCLRETKAGHPEHPLYLPYALRPYVWRSAS